MAKFVFAYRGGAVAANSAEEQSAMIAEWEAWFNSLGSAVLDRGNPFGSSISLISEEYDDSEEDEESDEHEEDSAEDDSAEDDSADDGESDDDADHGHEHSEHCDHDHDHDDDHDDDHDGEFDAELEKYLLTGFSIIEAEDLEEAANLARGCPALEHGGAVDVYETL